MRTDRAIGTVVSALDRVVPNRSAVVLRTTPDISDQGLLLLAALERRGVGPVSWLVDDPQGPLAHRLDCEVIPARSPRAVWAYLRARVVVHTHGVFGSRSTGRGKRLLNIWHGMPVKRLDEDSDVGRYQCDLTIATSPLHAGHLAATWGLPAERVRITGLPRNDLLVRPRPPLPAPLRERTGGRPLVVWLPTFRTTAVGNEYADGRELGTAFQFAGADPASVDAAMGRLGVHCLVKSHPLAPRPEVAELDNLTIWPNAEMEAADLTLYEVLAQADLLVTDHSSVWIDFLLTQRPMVFAISDREEYEASRGYYFDDLDALLPGPIVSDLPGLEAALGKAIEKPDRWAERRREALPEHHTHVDAGSADRVADLVVELLDAGR